MKTQWTGIGLLMKYAVGFVVVALVFLQVRVALLEKGKTRGPTAQTEDSYRMGEGMPPLTEDMPLDYPALIEEFQEQMSSSMDIAIRDRKERKSAKSIIMRELESAAMTARDVYQAKLKAKERAEGE